MPERNLEFYQNFLSQGDANIARVQRQQASMERQGSNFSKVFAPFQLAEAVGTTAYTDALMPLLNAAGLSRAGTVASEFNFSPESLIRPDLSLEGLAGLLGQGPASGFRSGTGEQIIRDRQHGSALSSVLSSRNPEAYGQFMQQRGSSVLQTLADIGVDPLTWYGLSSGARAVTKARGARGLIPFNRRLGLGSGGIEGGIRTIRETGKAAGLADDVIETAVREFTTQRLGRSPTFIEALAGAEDPRDFFRRGKVFNRNPFAELTEKSSTRIPTEAPKEAKSSAFADLLRIQSGAEGAATEARKTIDDVLRSSRVSDVPEVAQDAAQAATAPTARTFGDMMTDMGADIYDEVRPMVAKQGLYGEIADEVVQEVVSKTWESLATKVVDESANPIGKLRKTMNGKVKNAIRDARRHAGGLTGLGDETAGMARYEDVFGEPSAEAGTMFSLKRTGPAQTADVRKAIEGMREVSRVDDLKDGGILITMKNGKQIVAELWQEIASPEAGKVVGGQFFVDGNGVFHFRFTRHTDVTDVFEEFTHALIRTGLLDDDMPMLTRRFAKGIADAVEAEEAIVKGLKKARFAKDSVARRVWEMLVSLYERVTGRKTTTGTLKRIREGSFWRQPMESDPRSFLNKRTADMDISEARVAATTDQLTGAGNVRAFDEIQKAGKAFIMFDLDGFKGLNDTLGHAAGDRMLKEFVQRAGESGIDIYRKGGDEFAAAFDSVDEAKKMRDLFDEALSGATLEMADESGELYEIGYDFSRGVGKTEEAADADLYSNKLERLQRGIRPAKRTDPPVSLKRLGRRINKTRPGPLGSPAQSDTIRYSIKKLADEEGTMLDRLARKQQVRGVSDTDEEAGFVDLLRTKQGRKELFTRAAEKGWDELTRVRKAMIKQAGGQDVHKGRAAAHILLKNLSGLLSHTRHIIETGIKNPITGEILYDGSIVKAVHEPLANFLKKTKGRVLTPDMQRLMQDADNYLVSRRAVSLFDQAMAGARLAVTEGVTADNPLAYRKILSSDEISRVRDMDQDTARQFLTRKVEDWAKQNTGLGDEGFDDLSVARQVIADVEADPDKLAALDAVRNEMAKLNEAKLRYVHAKGLITDDTLASLLQMKDDYVPLQRVMGDTTNGVSTSSGGKLIKTLTGSQREILNPLTTSVEQTVKAMRQADVNEVFQRWLADADPKYLADIGVSRVEEGAEGFVKAIWENGERTFWKFEDEAMFRALEKIGGNMDPQSGLMKVLGVYKNAVREFVTKSPGFPVRNFIRDSFMRAITSDYGTGLLAGFKGIDPNELDAFIRAGGDQAGFYGKVSKAYAEELANATRQIAKDPKTVLMQAEDAKNFMAGAWEKWGDALSRSEMQNRLAEFRAAREEVAKQFPDMAQSEIDRIAAYKARDLMDFAVVGEWGRHVNAIVPFFNPAVQGTSKILRTAMENPQQFARRLSQYVVMPSVGVYMYNVSVGADKEYRNLPAYRRDLYWNLKVGDRWLTIPKPFEAGVLGTFPERLIDYAASGDPVALQGVFPSGGDMGTLVKGVSPFDEGLLAGPFRPVIEIIANKDLFRDRAIVPPWEEKLDPRLRKGAQSASWLGKTFAKVTGQVGILEDPRQIDYLLRSLGSEYGRIATDLTGPEPTRNLAQNATGGFLRRDTPWAYQSVQNVLQDAQRKGINRRKEHRAFLDQVRGTAEAPTRTNIDALLQSARQERQRIKSVSFDDLLLERKR